jgi:hypothetical protein
MPLIMEDLTYNMDDDDLFGDVEPVALPGITAAPPKGLASRLDELSASGNCQYVCLFFSVYLHPWTRTLLDQY